MQFKSGVFSLAGLALVFAFGLYLSSLKPIQIKVPVDEVTTELLAGRSLDIPQQAGGWKLETEEHVFMALLGFKKIGFQNISLCNQLVNTDKRNERFISGHLIPIKIGYSWADLKSTIDKHIKNGQIAHKNLRNVLLDSPDFNIPAVIVKGDLFAENLEVNIRSPLAQVYINDGRSAGINTVPQGGKVAFGQEAWLLWQEAQDKEIGQYWLGDRALRLKRISFPDCDLGALHVAIYQASENEMEKQSQWPLYQVPNRLEGETQFKTVTLKSGITQLTPQIKPETEDGALFSRLLETGLVQVDHNQQIVSAPRDLARIKKVSSDLLVDNQQVKMFSAITWDDETASVQADLYGQQAGPYVRKQIKRFNQERLMGALRLKAMNKKALQFKEKSPFQWQSMVGNQYLELGDSMPLYASSLFKKVPIEWMPWQRVKEWPVSAHKKSMVVFKARFNHAAKGEEHFTLLTVGQNIKLIGASIVKKEWRCVGACQKGQGVALLMEFKLNAGAKQLTVKLQPQQGKRLVKLYKSEFRHIVLNKQGKLSWRDMKNQKSEKRLMDIAISDRNGQALWQEGKLTEEAKFAELSSLVGVNKLHTSSLVDMLSRSNHDQVDAKITLDLRMQRLAQQALEQGVKKVSSAFKGKDHYQQQRKAALIVMDAENGEILAMAGYPTFPKWDRWQDVLGFNAMRTAQSPLRVQAIQQLGNKHNRPGSTFKLLTSLLLEQEAETNPTIATLLKGVGVDEFNRLGSENGYSFTAESGCYPAFPLSTYCLWNGDASVKNISNKPVVNNFGFISTGVHETPKRQMGKESIYGLEQALRDSLNTWYVWLYEMTDKTLLNTGDLPGVPDTRALSLGAMDQVRPMNKLMRLAGFEEALDLSGGLLADDYKWRGLDVLRSSKAQMDTVIDRHNLRIMSIGLRSYVTPLNMALVSASIASEKWVRPTLLAELNQQSAEVDDFLPLSIRTDRIRKGMKRVPQDGSASLSFSGAGNAWLRKSLYAKTGTAPVKVGKKELNTAWITGWLEAGTIPKQRHNLAFACQVTHSKSTGGSSCGPIVQTFFSALKKPAQGKSKQISEELGLDI